jgi:hypothetical protein
MKNLESYKLSERREEFCKALLADAERLRREKPSMDANPLAGEQNVVIDYGRSGQAMENAMAHLRESIPNGQRCRTEAAFLALQHSLDQHRVWLRAKGYHV